MTSTLHDVLLSASALPVDRRAAFLEKQHAFWSREFGRLHNNSADDRDAYQIMLGVWDMLEELTR